MKAHRWVVPKPLRGERALELLQASAALGHYTNDGPCVRATEAALHAHMRLGADFAVTLASSGTAALHALVAAFGMARGAALRVVTQASTFPCAVQGSCIGALVVDNDDELHGPCMVALERYVEDFDAVLVTNFFGSVAALDAYTRWCESRGKVLLCDSAATPMTFLPGGRNACEWGNGSIISCHETKPLGRGEGGAIIMRRDCAAFPHLRRALNFGFAPPAREWHVLASNWRMSDIAAAFFAARLEALTPAVYARAHANALTINATLQHPGVAPHVRWAVAPPLQGEGVSVLLGCLWLWTTTPVEDLEAFGAAHAIDARRYYTPLADAAAVPRAAKWYRHSVNLPFLYDCCDDAELTRGVLALAAWVAARSTPQPIALVN